MLRPLPLSDSKLAADRQRPAQVVQYGAVTVRRLHELSNALLRRRAADPRRVADGGPAGRDAIVDTVHADGVIVRLDRHLDAVERDVEQRCPDDVSLCQTATEAGPDQHARVGAQASAAVAAALVGDELPAAVLDVAGDAAADSHGRGRRALPDRPSELQRPDITFDDGLQVFGIRHGPPLSCWWPLQVSIVRRTAVEMEREAQLSRAARRSMHWLGGSSSSSPAPTQRDRR